MSRLHLKHNFEFYDTICVPAYFCFKIKIHQKVLRHKLCSKAEHFRQEKLLSKTLGQNPLLEANHSEFNTIQYF